MLASSKKYDAMQLKKFADHENMATTEIYVHLGDEIVKEMSENMVDILDSLIS
jgi:site-specific recombinase XerD